MEQLGRMLFFTGLGLALVGLVFWWGGGRSGLGHLPGDLVIEKERFRFYFPLATCLLISLLLSLILWFFRR